MSQTTRTDSPQRIIEVAEFSVRPEEHAAFGKALSNAAAEVLSKATGYQEHRILSCQETPGRYLLTVAWDSVEDHTVGFRQSPAFAQWRELIGPFFISPPTVAHFDIL